MDVSELFGGYSFNFDRESAQTFEHDGKYFLVNEGKYHCFQLEDGRVLNLEDDWDEIKALLHSQPSHSGNFINFVYEADASYVTVRRHGKDVKADLSFIEQVYWESKGDGNDLNYTFKFTNPKNLEDYFFVNFDGWYSSWDSSSLDTAYVSRPYVFTETRYTSLA